MATTWWIRKRHSERLWGDTYIIQRIRSGDLVGDEAVRLRKEDPWVPLHSTPMWEDAHAGTALATMPPEQAALQRRRHTALSPLIGHVLVFLGVMLTTHFPGWGVWWLLGLVAHAGRVYGELGGTNAEAAPLLVAPPRQLSGPSTPLLNAIVALDKALSQRSDDDPLRAEIADLHAAAVGLEARLSEIDGLLGATNVSALETERAKMAFEPGMSKALDALDERIASATTLADTRATLDGERVALLHQVEALRLGLATVDRGAKAPDLTGRVRDLRMRAAAEREVERMR